MTLGMVVTVVGLLILPHALMGVWWQRVPPHSAWLFGFGVVRLVVRRFTLVVFGPIPLVVVGPM